MFVRERAAGMYDIWVYACTKWFAEIPISLITPLVFNLVLYFAIGLTDTFSGFFSVYLILLLLVQAATAIGYFLSSMFNHASTAVAFAPIFNMPFNLLGGFMINLQTIREQAPQKYVAWL